MEYTTNYLSGIVIAIIIIWSALYLTRAASIRMNHDEELLTVQVIGRAVGLALRTVIETIRKDDWKNAAYHIAVCESRLDLYQPVSVSCMYYREQLIIVVSEMKHCVEAAKAQDWNMANTHLVSAAHMYNACTESIRRQRNGQPK